MDSYDVLLDANSSNNDRTLNGGNFNVNGTMNFRSFTTSGNVNITGDGTVTVNESFNFHTATKGGSRTLTITPDGGGSIAFIANWNVLIGPKIKHTVIVNSGVTFYSRASGPSPTTYKLSVDGAFTTLDDVVLLSRRNMTVQGGVDISSDSILFVDDAGATTTNNHLDVAGDSDVTSVDGTLISLSTKDPGLIIQQGGSVGANTSITGIVYAYGSGGTGICQIHSATVRGTLVCNRFSSNQITNAKLTYDSSFLPVPLPEGFEIFFSKKPNSYDGL